VFLANPRPRIFVGNSAPGLMEIAGFPIKGKLLRKIRKQYSPVPVSEITKKKTWRCIKKME